MRQIIGDHFDTVFVIDNLNNSSHSCIDGAVIGKQTSILKKMSEFVMFISDRFRLSIFVLKVDDMHPLIQMIQRSEIILELMVFGVNWPLYLLAFLYLEVVWLKVIVHNQNLVRKNYFFSWRSSDDFRLLLFHFLKSCIGAVLRLLHYLSVLISLIVGIFNLRSIILFFLLASYNFDGSAF